MFDETKQYEELARDSLRDCFKNMNIKVEVENQWIPFKGEAVSKYSPIVDVAVGPFAYGEDRYEDRYDYLTKIFEPALNQILSYFKENSKGFSFERKIITNTQELRNVNRNARCFVCIEIEKSGSRKHRLGDIVNACSLGRIGVIIAWDSKVLKSFLRITEYFSFLRGRQKPTYETRNLAIVLRGQFLKSLMPIKR